MKDEKRQIKVGDLVLVQPMRYSISFVNNGGLANLSQETPIINENITHHWTGDGFKARVIELEVLETRLEGERRPAQEEYLKVKIFGKGRKHFVKRNGEKTKEMWIQTRLVSKCKEQGKNKKEK